MKLKCEDCGWLGFQKECIKAFEPIFFIGGDVEPCLECPECNSRDLVPTSEVGEEVQQDTQG